MNDTPLPIKGTVQRGPLIDGAPLTLAGIACKTYVLLDGRRVVDASDFNDVWVALMRDDAKVSLDEWAAFARMRVGMAAHG